MSCFDPRGSLLNGHGAGEALDNGDIWKQYWDQPEVETTQFGTSPDYAISMHLQSPHQGSMNVQPPQLAQQPAGTFQFGTTPNHAILNPGTMNVQPPQLAQQPAGTFHFGTTPNHAILNPGLMNVQPSQLAQQPGTFQFGTTPNHATLNHGTMNVQPPQLAQQPAGTFQFGTAPNHAILNPRSMNVQPPLLAQQPGAINNVNASISTQMNSFPLAEPGTSQSSNITNADAEKRARIKQSKRKCWEKKEEKRRENEEKVVEFANQMNDLREVNARLVKEVDEAKIKQKNDEQELSYFKEEVSRLNNKLKGQTMQVAVLSEKLVASPEATEVAEENKQLRRTIELLTTASNNPDIIKTVELQEENEKLKRELKKLRIVNDALCDKMNKDEQ